MIEEIIQEFAFMSSSQVVLYFDKPEDAVRFTVAASSVLAADEPASAEAIAQVAQEFGKVSRIKIEEGQSSKQSSAA
jgi:hypothetical protein